MNNKKQNNIIDIFKSHNGYARSKDILANGFHSRKIKEMVEGGNIVKVKNGLYKLAQIPSTSNQSFIDVSKAVPESVVCLLSALSYYELTTFNPSMISVAIYRKSWRPKLAYPPVEFYYFSQKQFQSGIVEIKIKDNPVRIYCMEKTICDCFRYRNKLGVDIAKEGLSEYLKQKNRNIEKLLKYAQICRIKPLIQTWLDAIL